MHITIGLDNKSFQMSGEVAELDIIIDALRDSFTVSASRPGLVDRMKANLDDTGAFTCMLVDPEPGASI